MPKRSIPEAAESNAGDDFHVIWTVKKSFDLLNFDDKGLKAITLEGIDPKNESKLDPFGDQLLGVDIAEYFGGENFAEAEKVVVSQLKFSTRKVNDNWIFSELYKGKKSRSKDGSVFHRLAQIYKIFLDEYGRELVLGKLSIKLVSNRNISPKQKQIVLDIQNFLVNRTKTHLNIIYKNFPENQKALTKIHDATKLKSIEFVDFLRLLDFEDCGTSSSYYQKIEIVRALRELGFHNSGQFKSLYLMVSNKMLPLAKKQRTNKINEIDFLQCLDPNLISKENLFPVKNSFEEITNLIEREQVPSLIDKIVNNNTGKPICIHGGAGIGKSTTVNLIKKNFPTDSEVILFDCYGGGSYLNPSDRRHLHKEAIIQISNELAKRIGSNFLLPTESDSYILLRQFKSRIQNAVEILKKRNPNAVLVLIVDAGDNSVTAADESQTKSFIHDLVKENYVDGFRLVVTSRSHKVPSLKLPENYLNLPLAPFDFKETELHLKSYFPESTEEEIQDFHKLTNGIPRVQAYALDLKNKGINEVINYLKPNGKKVEDLIEDRIEEAAIKLGNKGNEIINIFFTYLISLPRPIPISYIKALSEQSEGLLEDLATDIWRGLILDKDSFSFRDADFEDFIREKHQPNLEIHQKIASLFLEKANEDEYASINLGVALCNANDIEKLKNIVINEEYISLPVDPIRKKEVYIERTKLAMKVSCNSDDNLSFFKLAFLAADAAKTDTALHNLLIDNAALVASFGESDTLQKLHLRSKEKTWSGSFHYELAAAYSRNSNSIDLAKLHLKTAEKWLGWWQRQRDNDMFEEIQITDDDIAYGSEAIFRIYGLQASIKWLKSWSPKYAVFNATNILVDNILKYSKNEQIFEWLTSTDLPLYGKLIVLAKTKLNKKHPFDLKKIADSILRALSSGVNFEIYVFPSILAFCELYIHSNHSHKIKILKILESISVELSADVPTFSGSKYVIDIDESIIDIFMRKHTLKASLTDTELNLQQIYPAEIKDLEKEKDDERKEYLKNKKKKFDRFYTHAISIYQIRADFISNNNIDGLQFKFESLCELINKDWEFRYYDQYWAQYKLNFLALALVDLLPFIERKIENISLLVKSFENKNQNRISIRIDIANKFTSINELKQNAIKLLDEVDTLIQESTFTSSDMVNYYIKCAKIIRPVDKNISKYYFDKAIDALSEIDIEARDQIKCLHSLTQLGLPNESPELAFEFARFVEDCQNRLGDDDYFPSNEGVIGIANLDCATSFAVICRWNHRYTSNITDHILSILKISIKKGFITPEIGGSMLPLNTNYWENYVHFIKLLIENFDKNSSSQKNNLIKWVLRDLQINCATNVHESTISKIFKAIKNGRFLEEELIQRFEKYHKFINEVRSSKTENRNKTYTTYRNQESDKYEKSNLNIDEVDICSASSLNNVLRKIRKDEFHFARPHITEFFKDAKKICEPENYVIHLEAIIEINTDLLSFHTFEEVLKERLEDWGFHPMVKKWKEDNFPKILKSWFSFFSDNHKIYFDRIQKFADIFAIETLELAKIIIKMLPDNINKLSSTALYQTITFLKKCLNQEENENLIRWVLFKSNSKIKDDFADGIWNEKYLPPTDSNEVIAYTIRFTLGCPDKRIRWRGIHSLRRIVNSGNMEILKILLSHQNNIDCNPFQNKDYIFFWISAKLYLWICIERLSKEKPDLISQLKSEILQELKNQELPHVLILYFVQQTCLNLKNHNTSVFTKQELKTIQNVLCSDLSPLKQKKEKENDYSSNEKEWKFKFDTLETLEYWYRPIGRCFNLSGYEVADLAEKYIIEKWGFIGNPSKENYVEEDYSLTYNRKGDLPIVETLKIYFEYHGMYCAASDLLKTKPLAKSKDDWGSWEYWLKSEGLTFKNIWLSDINDPIPLDRKFWINDIEKREEQWLNGIKINDYDEILGLTNEAKLNTIIPYGGYTRYIGENYESVSIRSALVSPKASGALLRALQTAKDSYNYRIPFEDDGFEINKNDFHLIGWLKEKSSEHSGLDKHDPFIYEPSRHFILFGNEVEKHYEIKYTEDFKKAFYDGSQIFLYENWSNETMEDKYNRLESTGFLLKLQISFLLQFLRKSQMDLIIKCSINRYLKYKYLKDRERKNNAKIYLIKSNGKVKTIRGSNYKIG